MRLPNAFLTFVVALSVGIMLLCCYVAVGVTQIYLESAHKAPTWERHILKAHSCPVERGESCSPKSDDCE